MLSFNNMKIKKRMLLILAVVIACTFAIQYRSLYEIKHELMDGRQKNVKDVVEMAASVVNHYIGEVKDGELTLEEAKKEALDKVATLRYDNGNYVWINDYNSVMIMHPVSKALVGKDLSDFTDKNGTKIFSEFTKAAKKGGGFVDYVWGKPGEDKDKLFPKISYVIGVDEWQWAVGSGIYVDDVENTYKENAKQMLIMASGIILIMLILFMYVSGTITKGITGINSAMLRLADNDMDVDLTKYENKSEIGDMAKAVDIFKQSMIKAEELSQKQEEENKKREKRASYIEDLTKNFDLIIGELMANVQSALEKMRTASSNMSKTADKTNSQATSVAAASEQATSNVETVAAAAEELSSSISEISKQVEHSSIVAEKASFSADETNHKVQGLAEAASKIGDVVKLINDIADKTNLLALNATIEAARAGDAGKGFAVVANEVKNLANQTTKATEEITDQIDTVQNEVSSVVTAITDIVSIIDDIRQISGAIASSIEEQNSATQEIAGNVAQASQGTRDVSKNILSVLSAAHETEESASSVSSATEDLSKQMSKMRKEVDAFLGAVKAV